MLPSDVGTCAWLVDELAAARVVDRERLLPLLREFTADSPYADADAFAKYLIRKGILTQFQAQRAVDGEASKLLLGAYLLVDTVGSGSMGLVHRAIGRADSKPYAVRILPKRAWNVGLARKQAMAFERLPKHDCIVPFLDVGTAQGLHYLVWPFVEGRSLESIILEYGPMPSGEAARIGFEIAEVLKLCHARGVVHGFIKPSNVLIGTDGRARLLDFGIGALLAENADADSLVDTVSRAEVIANMLECCAPESVVDSSLWTPAGDQYSLGCTLYFALTGRYPFPGGTFVDKIVNHQRNQPTPLRSLNPDIPVRLADVVDQLMKKAPGDRYRKIDDLIRALVPLAASSGVSRSVAVNVKTPVRGGGKLTIGAPIEPPRIDIPSVSEKRGLFGRLLGGGSSTFHVTLVAAGPAPVGATAILHVYTHGSGEADRLSDAIRSHPASPRMLGRAACSRGVAAGEAFGLHLGIDGAVVVEPLLEVKRESGVGLHRFVVSLPAELPHRPLKGKLMIGHKDKLIGQIDFVMPVIS